MTDQAKPVPSAARWSLPPWADVGALALLGTTALAACGTPQTTAEAPPTDSELVAVKPLSIAAQGRSLQGMSLQGATLQGRSLQGATLQAVALAGRRLDKTDIVGVRQGTVLSGRLSDGSAVDLSVTAVEADALDPTGEITLYTVLYRNPVSGQMENICAPDLAGQQKAIAVAGTWDASGDHDDDRGFITLGCTSGVVAKCVRWGYRPWEGRGNSMTDLHQACTRMARADYCGDGVSHTIDGTWVDIWDGAGIQRKTPDSEMPFEATWSTKGATCIAKPRYFGLPEAMDASAWPDTVCQRDVRKLAMGAVPKLVKTPLGTTTTAGDFCKLRPVGGSTIMADASYLNVITQ